MKNGDKGADTFTVPEEKRIRLTEALMALREGGKTKIEFPSSLTNTERKFVHSLASQLGLKSKSSGKDANRRITVTKANQSVNSKFSDKTQLPVLKLGQKGEHVLEAYFLKHPPTEDELLEAQETGGALLRALKANTAVAISAALADLDIMEPTMKQRREKKVDLERRKRFHAQAQQKKRQSKDYNRVLRQRAQLPAFSHQKEIIEAVARHPVTIIQGDTGCGKSTQIPQFLLDANPTASIVVTQRG